MLYVIATGGKQYLVKSGEVLKIEKLLTEVGGKIVFDQVLMSANDDGSDAIVGTPLIDGVKVMATVEKQGKDKRILVQKYKRKTRYHKSRGHRQRFTQVKIA